MSYVAGLLFLIAGLATVGRAFLLSGKVCGWPTAGNVPRRSIELMGVAMMVFSVMVFTGSERASLNLVGFSGVLAFCSTVMYLNVWRQRDHAHS